MDRNVPRKVTTSGLHSVAKPAARSAISASVSASRLLPLGAGDAHEVEVVDTIEEPMAQRKLPPLHPGEILLEEFLTP